MEIVVTGRNVEVPDHFRIHVAEKLARLERYDHKIIGMEVELFHEPNRRQAKSCQRVEITGRGGRCGQMAARAEACGPDFYAALDGAISKLESRLRRAHDRHRVHYDRRERDAVRAMGGSAATLSAAVLVEERTAEQRVTIPHPRESGEEPVPGRVVRHKEHPAKPMSVDEALSRMELVGHDFYLFSCADTGLPSVVYRCKGYDYGVIRLT